MKSISLVIGETASLPQEIIKKNEMVFVPYVIDWRDGEDLPGENIFQKMREAEKRGIKTLPKTSQPSPWTFKKIFEETLKSSEKVLCITLSAGLSGGYNSALQARRMLKEDEGKRIHIVDCENVSAGEGLFDLKAMDLINEEKEIEGIMKELKEFIPKVHLFGMLEDPKWLEAGGRMNHTLASLVRQMQKIGMRPLIGIKDGVVKSVALRMQAKDIPTALLKELENETKGKKVKVAIVHADNLKDAERLREMIQEKMPNTEIAFLNLLDSVIGVHVGPGTLICAWHEI
ncbi:MAG TPA: DegV family protein [Candidatus Pacearchaeota archaeon]|nr:DegV family protein [Candidatus Pacearchaeota archaeon]HOK93933.1 DegV family protein [Candidatus Pacearchaeota archaeon]HPO75004.1 DegV family protein [Candidatus Pacearchaeota archaeon]